MLFTTQEASWGASSMDLANAILVAQAAKGTSHAKGDFSVIGINLKRGPPVPDFDHLADAVRKGPSAHGEDELWNGEWAMRGDLSNLWRPNPTNPCWVAP